MQDRFLPIANVARIMRNAIPRNGKVSSYIEIAREKTTLVVNMTITFHVTYRLLSYTYINQGELLRSLVVNTKFHRVYGIACLYVHMIL